LEHRSGYGFIKFAAAFAELHRLHRRKVAAIVGFAFTKEHTPMRLLAYMIIALSTPSAVMGAEEKPVDVAAARASLSGNWQGSLEYLDYSANEWFGIPVTTRIEDQGDGATTIRKSDFDDGPKVGIVRITSAELFDAAAGTVTIGTFRKGREVEVVTYKVRMDGVPNDAANWTMIEEVTAKDNNRPAVLRLTTTRTGDKIETLKQVDFMDDDKQEWLSRNRTKLMRVKD
jgi:hypothetical protein